MLRHHYGLGMHQAVALLLVPDIIVANFGLKIANFLRFPI